MLATFRHRGSQAALLALMLVATGCGYSLVGTAANIPEHVQTVYLQPFENRTQTAQVEQILTQAVANELVQRPRLKVVASADEADSEIRGIVSIVNTTPVTFDANGRATEYQIAITCSVVFQDIKEDKPIWKNDRYLFRESFESDPSALAFFNQEKIALEEVSDRFARTLVSDLLEGF